MSNIEIQEIKKEDREDISLYTVTLANGSTISVEAGGEEEARTKVNDYLGSEEDSMVLDELSREVQEESESEES